MSKKFSRIKLTYLFTNWYLSLAQLVLIQLLLMLKPSWNEVEIKLYQRCFNVVSTSYTNVVSTLWNVENSTSDFVSFSTSDQRYFNVDPQRWNNGGPTLKCWLGGILSPLWLSFSCCLILFIIYIECSLTTWKTYISFFIQ